MNLALTLPLSVPAKPREDYVLTSLSLCSSIYLLPDLPATLLSGQLLLSLQDLQLLPAATEGSLSSHVLRHLAKLLFGGCPWASSMGISWSEAWAGLRVACTRLPGTFGCQPRSCTLCLQRPPHARLWVASPLPLSSGGPGTADAGPDLRLNPGSAFPGQFNGLPSRKTLLRDASIPLDICWLSTCQSGPGAHVQARSAAS